jgi:hypothetical protein
VQRRHLELHVAAVFCGGFARKTETASVPGRLRAVRRFTRAGQSSDYFLLALSSWRYEPGAGTGGMTLEDATFRSAGAVRRPVGSLVLVSGYHESRSVTTSASLDR